MEHDLRSLNASDVLDDEEWLCAEAKTVALNETHQRQDQFPSGQLKLRKAMAQLMQNGFFGQTMQQFELLFEEMDMLVSQFRSAGTERGAVGRAL